MTFFLALLGFGLLTCLLAARIFVDSRPTAKPTDQAGGNVGARAAKATNSL